MVFAQGMKVISFQIGFYLDEIAETKLVKTVSMLFFLFNIDQLSLHKFIEFLSSQKISCCLVFFNVNPEIIINDLNLTVLSSGHSYWQFFDIPIVQGTEDTQFTTVKRHHDTKIKVNVLVKSANTFLEYSACVLNHQLNLPPMTPFLMEIISSQVLVENFLLLTIKTTAHECL